MRTYALVLFVLLLVTSASGQMQLDPVLASDYVPQRGNDLYTLAEHNRLIAERDGRGGMALTWRQVKRLNPHLYGLPVVYKHGRPYVYFRPETPIRGLPFLANEQQSRRSVLGPPQATAELAGTIGVGGASTNTSMDAWVAGAAGAVLLAFFVIGLIILQRFVFPSLLDLTLPGDTDETLAFTEAELDEAEAALGAAVEPIAKPPSPQFPTREAYEEFRTSVLRRNPRDPEHMGPGFRLPTAPPATLEEHAVTSAALAIMQGHNTLLRQIVSVNVAGGEWPTMFYTVDPNVSDIRIAEPRGHTLIVGIYYDEDGTVSGYTLHWRFCLNGMPLGRLSEREQHFIGDETMFGDLKVLRNESGFPDITLEDLSNGLRERFGVREWPDEEEPTAPRLELVPTAPQETAPVPDPSVRTEDTPAPSEDVFPEDRITYRLLPNGKFPRSKPVSQCGRTVRLVLEFRGQRHEFTDFCGVHVPFGTGKPRVMLRQKEAHLDNGISFLIEGGKLTIKRGKELVQSGIPVGTADWLRFPERMPSTHCKRARENARREAEQRLAA